MTTAKTSPEGIERIAHPTAAYCFLEIRAGNAVEFMKFREELLTAHPDYSFALQPATTPAKAGGKAAVTAAMKAAKAKGADVEVVEEDETSGEADVAESEVAEPAATSAPTHTLTAAQKAILRTGKKAPVAVAAETPALSARDAARARIKAKKGA
jgi:hypothetical protein